MVIVNLQRTPKDKLGTMLIRARVDLLMALTMHELQMQVGASVHMRRDGGRALRVAGTGCICNMACGCAAPC